MAKVRLVLGSGGARGIAHIGVIEELINDGHEIVEVVGCSMGAVVGGIFCAGHLQPYKEWLLTLTRSAVFSLTDFTFTRQGFVKGEKVFSTILDMTGPQNIEDLPIPFTAVATDIANMSEVHINKGDLFRALRASIAIPGIFTPVLDDKTYLVDGGVLNPLPVDLISKKEDELVVAVNINAPSLTANIDPIKDNQKTETAKNWISISWPFSKKDQANQPPSYSLLDLLQTSYDHTQDRLTEMIIKHYRPDLVVNIPRTSCATFEFYKAKEMIDLGKRLYREALPVNSEST